MAAGGVAVSVHTAVPALTPETLARVALDRATARLGLVLAELETPSLEGVEPASRAVRAVRAALRELAGTR